MSTEAMESTSVGPVPAQICIPREKCPSILKAFKDSPINTVLEKMPKENPLKPHRTA